MRTPTLLALAVAAISLAGCSMFTPRPTEPVPVKILAINDFHGNLKPPPGGIRMRTRPTRAKTINVPAGGAEHLATAVARAARAATRTTSSSPPAT